MNNKNQPQFKITDDIDRLLDIIPSEQVGPLRASENLGELLEIILDLGRLPEARFVKGNVFLDDKVVSIDEINYVVNKVGSFTSDNRAGIERTLHRISALRSRRGEIIGLTLRVGRAVFGTIDIIRDVVEAGKNLLLLGKPGIGKTTKLREIARVLSEEFSKRVIVVDTSNEIAGDGDVPHPAIGPARRMQVPSPERQHAVMIEAVENHMPEVIIVDEIGTEAEALAARTIAERGVQLIATAHGNTIDNLFKNPILCDLVGGVQTVILGDEEARRRHTQKAVLERKAPPTFDIVVELRERDVLAVYHNIAETVDLLLKEKIPPVEIRQRQPDGSILKSQKTLTFEESVNNIEEQDIKKRLEEKDNILHIYLFSLNRAVFQRAINSLNLPVVVVQEVRDADIILSSKVHDKPNSKIVLISHERHIPLHIIKSNTFTQMVKFLKNIFRLHLGSEDAEKLALEETKDAVNTVLKSRRSIEISPQNAYIRRLQHQLAKECDLHSESVGDEPNRRVRIYP
jgi:stage III sporulation protein SpoIIIAA